MSSIQSSIELYDGFSAPLHSMINALNLTVSAFETMQTASSAPIDTSTITGARTAADEATMAFQAMQTQVSHLRETIAEIHAPDLSPRPVNLPQEPVEVPVTWRSDTLNVFTNTGVERFTQEIQSANSMLSQLAETQNSITQQAQSLTLLPSNAVGDIQNLQSRIENLQTAIAQLEQNPLNVGTNETNAQLERLRSQLSQTLSYQETLNEAMGEMNVSNINGAFLRLSQNISGVERSVRDAFSHPVEIPITWRSDNLDVFASTGAERFVQEIQSANTMLNQLAETQNSITQQAQNLTILPSNAVSDIESLQNRIQTLQTTIAQLEQNPLSVDTDEANAQIERLRAQLAQTLSYQETLNTAMRDMNVGNINDAFLRLSQNVSNIERSVRDSFSQPINIPVTWNTQGIEVFTNTGAERFQQEIQSAKNMIDALRQSQRRVNEQAANIHIFPSNAVTDLNNLQNRIQTIQTRITQIANNPINVGSDIANREIERLREQLAQTVQAQENLNCAVENMDISAANEAYNRLSQAVGATERYIRDNVNAQGQFNQAIREGADNAHTLTDAIKGFAAAYATIQTAKQVINLSDTMAQTQARLSLIVDDGGSVEELQNKIFASAQASHGSYLTTADAVSKLGLQASQAFNNTDEIIAFTELLNKQFQIAGTSAQGIDSVMLQLTQSMASGKLQGEELNAVLDNAAPIVQNIQKYLEEVMGIDASNIKELASEGVITAEVIKAALFYAADEINAKAAEMPDTFQSVWSSFQNDALLAFLPVLETINEFANSPAFQTFVQNATAALYILAAVIMQIFDMIGAIGTAIYDNWSWISPIIYGAVAALTAYITALTVYNAAQAIANGVDMISTGIMAAKTFAQNVHNDSVAMGARATFAETVAQYGFNAALLACPITWIVVGIIAIIAIIYAAVAAVNHFKNTTYSATGIICGVIALAASAVGNILIAVWNLIIDAIATLVNIIADFANFVGNVFHEPLKSIARLFFDLVDTILSLLQSLASAIDTIFGSQLAGAVQGWRNSLDGWVGDTFGHGKEIMASIRSEDLHLQRFEYGNAWNAGYSFGQGIDDKISNFSLLDALGIEIPSGDPTGAQTTADLFSNGTGLDGINNAVKDIADNTDKIADNLELSNEDLKLLRDIAERREVYKYTTANINIDLTNNNNLSSDMDLDGVTNALISGIVDAVAVSMEGAHI